MKKGLFSSLIKSRFHLIPAPGFNNKLICRSSEKTPRVFATLVIALPSKHEGGELQVTHAGKTQVFETSKYSDFGSSYLAWYGPQ